MSGFQGKFRIDEEIQSPLRTSFSRVLATLYEEFIRRSVGPSVLNPSVSHARIKRENKFDNLSERLFPPVRDNTVIPRCVVELLLELNWLSRFAYQSDGDGVTPVFPILVNPNKKISFH